MNEGATCSKRASHLELLMCLSQHSVWFKPAKLEQKRQSPVLLLPQRQGNSVQWPTSTDPHATLCRVLSNFVMHITEDLHRSEHSHIFAHMQFGNRKMHCSCLSFQIYVPWTVGDTLQCSLCRMAVSIQKIALACFHVALPLSEMWYFAHLAC